MKDAYGKLTSLVVYNTNYFHPISTKRVQIKFGLGKNLQSIKSLVSLHSNNVKLVSYLSVIFLPRPFFRHIFLLFINGIELGYLPA